MLMRDRPATATDTVNSEIGKHEAVSKLEAQTAVGVGAAFAFGGRRIVVVVVVVVVVGNLVIPYYTK
jgi:hypothetical protein